MVTNRQVINEMLALGSLEEPSEAIRLHILEYCGYNLNTKDYHRYAIDGLDERAYITGIAEDMEESDPEDYPFDIEDFWDFIINHNLQ